MSHIMSDAFELIPMNDQPISTNDMNTPYIITEPCFQFSDSITSSSFPLIDGSLRKDMTPVTTSFIHNKQRVFNNLLNQRHTSSQIKQQTILEHYNNDSQQASVHSTQIDLASPINCNCCYLSSVVEVRGSVCLKALKSLPFILTDSMCTDPFFEHLNLSGTWVECNIVTLLFEDHVNNDLIHSIAEHHYTTLHNQQHIFHTVNLSQVSKLIVALLYNATTQFEVELSDTRLPSFCSMMPTQPTPPTGTLIEICDQYQYSNIWSVAQMMGQWETNRLLFNVSPIISPKPNNQSTNQIPIKTVLNEHIRIITCYTNMTIADMGGIIKDSIEWPTFNKTIIFPEELNDVSFIELLRQQTQLLQIYLTPSSIPPLINLVGTLSAITEAKLAFHTFFGNAKATYQFQERRERRLKLLADRREGYTQHRMTEFTVDESLIGLIIGRQGEKLSRIAKEYQVELRVLPDDNGIRRIRAYGANKELIHKAREELEMLYEELILTPTLINMLCIHLEDQLQFISQRSGLHFMWMNYHRYSMILCGTRRCLSMFHDLLRTLCSSYFPILLISDY